MTRSRFGVLAAAAVASLFGTAGFAAEDKGGETKGCYRPSCGKSVKGHDGSCGGTKVEDLKDQKACETAGGAWTTAEDAEKLAH